MKPSSARRGRGGGGRAARQRLRRQLATEACRVERRLQTAVAPNFSGPVLGRANVVYEWSEKPKGTAHGGMGMVARLVERVGLAPEIDSSVHLLKPTVPTTSPTTC